MKTFGELKSIPTIEDDDKEFYEKYVGFPDNQQFIWKTLLADYVMIKVNAKYAVMLFPDDNTFGIYRVQPKTFNAITDGGLVMKYDAFWEALTDIKQKYGDKF